MEPDSLDHRLRERVAGLSTEIENGDLSGIRMIMACRDILWLWVRMGGESTDDPVISFCGIESETDYLLNGSQALIGRPVDRQLFELGSTAEAAEIERCYRFYRDTFVDAVRELRGYLEAHPRLDSSER